PLLERGTYPGRESTWLLSFPSVKVDRTVQDGDTVSLGGVTLTAHATPGHSPGCTSWSLSVQDGGAVGSGVIFCSATVAFNRLAPATYPGIVGDYRRTFAWARTYKTDIFLAPHAEMFGLHEKRARITPGAPNPFVDTAAFGTYIKGLEEEFETALARQG